MQGQPSQQLGSPAQKVPNKWMTDRRACVRTRATPAVALLLVHTGRRQGLATSLAAPTLKGFAGTNKLQQTAPDPLEPSDTDQQPCMHVRLCLAGVSLTCISTRNSIMHLCAATRISLLGSLSRFMSPSSS